MTSTRRRGVALALLALTVAAVVLTVTAHVFFAVPAGLLAGATYAAWRGASAQAFLDAAGDGPPVYPT